MVINTHGCIKTRDGGFRQGRGVSGIENTPSAMSKHERRGGGGPRILDHSLGLLQSWSGPVPVQSWSFGSPETGLPSTN